MYHKRHALSLLATLAVACSLLRPAPAAAQDPGNDRIAAVAIILQRDLERLEGLLQATSGGDPDLLRPALMHIAAAEVALQDLSLDPHNPDKQRAAIAVVEWVFFSVEAFVSGPHIEPKPIVAQTHGALAALVALLENLKRFTGND